VTYKQMHDQVMQWLGLQDITSYSESQLASDLLYQGTLDLLSRTRCVTRCVQLNVTADKDEYLLDHGILALVDMEDGARRRLRRDQQDQANDYGFTLIRSDLLRIVPTPSESGWVQVWAVLRPTQMAADSDSPNQEPFGGIPDEFHDAIVTYALWKGADYADDATTQNGEYYRTLYEGQDGKGGRLAQIRVLVNKRGTARAARRHVNLRSVSNSGAYT
jgi:hypothetical protein